MYVYRYVYVCVVCLCVITEIHTFPIMCLNSGLASILYFICLGTMKLSTHNCHSFICVFLEHTNTCQKLWHLLGNDNKQNGNTSSCLQEVQCLTGDTK